MKTLQELYDEVISSDELKKEFMAASSDESDAAAFLKKHGCDSSMEELSTFLKEKFKPENVAMTELEDADLDEVAGGGKTTTVINSIISVGIACAGKAICSAIDDDYTVNECMLYEE